MMAVEAECTECGQTVPATVSDGPVQVQAEHPSRVTADDVQVVWDEEGPEGVADWIRSMAPAPGFLRVQDAIRDALDGRGVDLPDVADIAYVATEAVMPLLGSSTPSSTTADVRDVSGLADRLRELGLHAAVALLDDCPPVRADPTVRYECDGCGTAIAVTPDQAGRDALAERDGIQTIYNNLVGLLAADLGLDPDESGGGAVRSAVRKLVAAAPDDAPITETRVEYRELAETRDRRDYLQRQLDIVYDAEYSRNDALTRRLTTMRTAGDELASAGEAALIGGERADWDRLHAQITEWRTGHGDTSADDEDTPSAALADADRICRLTAAGDALADAVNDLLDRTWRPGLPKVTADWLRPKLDEWRSVRGDAPTEPAAAADEVLLVRCDGRKGGQVTVGHSRLPVTTVLRALGRDGTIPPARAAYPDLTDEQGRVLNTLRRELAADDTAATVSRDELIDRFTAAVDNACDVAAIEIEVHELEPGPNGWQRTGTVSPLRRMVRALEGAGLLDETALDDREVDQ